MAYDSWPFVNKPTTDLQYSRLFRLVQRSGVAGAPATNELKLTSPNALMVTHLGVGVAYHRGFFFDNSSLTIIGHADANATNPRIDRVVLRLDFNQTLANRVMPFVIAGQPSTNPSPPNLTQEFNGIWDLPIARVRVDAGATSIPAANVFDERQFIGDQIGRWTTSTRPLNPARYEVGYNETLGYHEYWDGDSWEKLWKGVSWADIQNKPTTSTLDGRTLYVQSTQPGGANGDIWFQI